MFCVVGELESIECIQITHNSKMVRFDKQFDDDDTGLIKDSGIDTGLSSSNQTLNGDLSKVTIMVHATFFFLPHHRVAFLCIALFCLLNFYFYLITNY